MRDYPKPKDSEQSTRQMNQALLLLKKIQPFYSRFMAHYETLYRYLEKAAITMGTLTQRSIEDKYGKRLEYHLQDKCVAWLWSVMALGTSFRILILTRTKWTNDPKLEPCVWPDLHPGDVGGYTAGCGIGCAAYYRSCYLPFDSRWRRDR